VLHAVTLEHSTSPAYGELAAFYDRFTSDHDHESWLGSLEAIARVHGLNGRRVLDVACGTGKSFLPLLARGYAVVACDASAAMLEVAATHARGRARLVRADMRELPELGRFDLVTCLADALNYLLEERDLRAAFASAARACRPGALYVFDLTTRRGYDELFATEAVRAAHGLAFAWRGERRDDERYVALLDVHAGAATGPRLASSRHEQRHWPIATTRRLLVQAGFEPLVAYGLTPDGATDPVADERRHHKVVHVARARGLPESEGGESCVRRSSTRASSPRRRSSRGTDGGEVGVVR
jgi:SAM-dependent methyltransferase